MGEKNIKTVGILGGLGPETTAHFYMSIIALCKRNGIPDRPPVLIWNIPLPYALEKTFITTGERVEEYLPFLQEGAKKLEQAGADFIVIPCNSVHIFIEDVRKSVHIPILSIVEETISFLKEKHVEHVGMLATTATIKSGLYNNVLKSQGVEISTPAAEAQEKLSDLITHVVQNGLGDCDKNLLPKLIQNFIDKNVGAVLLACTDLQLLMHDHSQIPIYDTMNILAESAVKKICT